jgi:Flp pilus assembly protein TadD
VRSIPFELSDGAPDAQAQDQGPDPVFTPAARADAAESAEHGAPSAPAPRESAEVLYGAAREAAARGEGSRAARIYRELLALDPGHLKARNNLAIHLDEDGDHEGALKELDLCLEIAPGNREVLVNRGAVYGAMARFPEAERDLSTVLESDPSDAEAHFNLGIVKSRRGLWRDAVPHLRRAIELDTSRAAAYFHLGEALNRIDDLDGALQAYQRSAELRPDNPRAVRGIGIILDRLNRSDEAAQMYRRSRELAST